MKSLLPDFRMRAAVMAALTRRLVPGYPGIAMTEEPTGNDPAQRTEGSRRSLAGWPTGLITSPSSR